MDYYILHKEKSINDKPTLVHQGSSFTGIIDPSTFNVGQSLLIQNPEKWRITSVITKIEETNKDEYLITTLNSIYTLKKL